MAGWSFGVDFLGDGVGFFGGGGVEFWGWRGWSFGSLEMVTCDSFRGGGSTHPSVYTWAYVHLVSTQFNRQPVACVHPVQQAACVHLVFTQFNRRPVFTWCPPSSTGLCSPGVHPVQQAACAGYRPRQKKGRFPGEGKLHLLKAVKPFEGPPRWPCG